MKQKTKEKIKMALVIIGIIIGGVIALELLRAFMWACYYAGIPM